MYILSRLSNYIKRSKEFALLGGLAVPLLIFSIISIVYGPVDILLDSTLVTYSSLILGLTACIPLLHSIGNNETVEYIIYLQSYFLLLWISLALVAIYHGHSFYGSLGTNKESPWVLFITSFFFWFISLLLINKT